MSGLSDRRMDFRTKREMHTLVTCLHTLNGTNSPAHVLTSLGAGFRKHACNSRLELTKWIDCKVSGGPHLGERRWGSGHNSLHGVWTHRHSVKWADLWLCSTSRWWSTGVWVATYWAHSLESQGDLSQGSPKENLGALNQHYHPRP